MSYVSFNTEERKYPWEEKRGEAEALLCGWSTHGDLRQPGHGSLGQRDPNSAVDVAHVVIAHLMCEGHRAWGIRNSISVKDPVWMCFCWVLYSNVCCKNDHPLKTSSSHPLQHRGWACKKIGWVGGDGVGCRGLSCVSMKGSMRRRDADDNPTMWVCMCVCRPVHKYTCM